MQKLKKSDRQRFEDVCRKIRQALHLDHLDRKYHFSPNDDGSIATTTVSSRGWRLIIHIKPQFWDHEFEQQARFLIHEHIHVCLHPYHQAVDCIENEWVSPHCKSQVQEKQHIGAEIAVDHLESVLYDLLKDRF